MEKSKLIVELQKRSNQNNIQGIISRYLLINKNKLLETSITNLSLEIETTPSTVTKFIMSLGLSGYKELKAIFNQNIKNVDFNEYAQIIKGNIDFINNQSEKIKLLAKQILECKNIYLMGYGNNVSPAKNFISRISNIVSNKFLLIESREDYFLPEILKDTTVIYLTFSNSHKDIHSYLKNLNTADKIWEITNNPSKNFNFLEILHNEETYHRAWGAQMSVTFLFNLILLEIERLN